jgi:hypothetical protein
VVAADAALWKLNGVREWRKRGVGTVRQSTASEMVRPEAGNGEKMLRRECRDHRWRTKLHFGSRESLDDYHGPSTLGAAPKIVRALDA